MNNIAPRWTGMDLVPLPHESSVSVLLRFGWRNALDATILKNNLDGRKINKKGQSFLVLKWLERNNFSLTAGWNVPSPDEMFALKSFEGVSDIFLSPILRICPVCIECGYHSYWYQVLDLQVCPLHNCKLMDECLSCGKLLSDYRFCKELFSRPYLCANCKKPISGAPLSLECHLDFRINSQLIETRFEPIANWLLRSEQPRAIVRNLKKQYGSLTRFAHWCEPVTFAREILSTLNTDKYFEIKSENNFVTALSWKVRMCTTRTTPLRKRYTGIARRRLTKSVYFATLCMLKNWIIHDPQFGFDSIDRILEIDQNGNVDISAWRSELLAVHLMRAILESYNPVSLRETPIVVAFRFDHISEASLYTFEGREPRLAWRAIFLGYFAILYWTINRAKQQGHVLELRKLRTSIDTSVAKVLFVEPENVLGGVVLFPTIPGMPLAPFARRTRSDLSNCHLPTGIPVSLSESFEWNSL